MAAGPGLRAAGSWLAPRARGAIRGLAATRAAAAPVVAVYGPRRLRGDVVARALGAELAARDASGAAAVSCESVPGAVALSTAAGGPPGPPLAGAPAATRALGRLCLVAGADPLALADFARALRPVVLDAGSAALADATRRWPGGWCWWPRPGAEPSLAEVAAGARPGWGREPRLVVNGPGAEWEGRASVRPRRATATRRRDGGGGERRR